MTGPVAGIDGNFIVRYSEFHSNSTIISAVSTGLMSGSRLIHRRVVASGRFAITQPEVSTGWVVWDQCPYPGPGWSVKAYSRATGRTHTVVAGKTGGYDRTNCTPHMTESDLYGNRIVVAGVTWVNVVTLPGLRTHRLFTLQKGQCPPTVVLASHIQIVVHRRWRSACAASTIVARDTRTGAQRSIRIPAHIAFFESNGRTLIWLNDLHDKHDREYGSDLKGLRLWHGREFTLGRVGRGWSTACRAPWNHRIDVCIDGWNVQLSSRLLIWSTSGPTCCKEIIARDLKTGRTQVLRTLNVAHTPVVAVAPFTGTTVSWQVCFAASPQGPLHCFLEVSKVRF